MIEYVNIENFMKNYYKNSFKLMQEQVDKILFSLSKLRNKKISLKYVKCYHYKGIIHPRPLHIDTLSDYSYKIFFY